MRTHWPRLFASPGATSACFTASSHKLRASWRLMRYELSLVKSWKLHERAWSLGLHHKATTPHKVSKAPPLNLEIYRDTSHTVGLTPHWCKGCLGEVCCMRPTSRVTAATST